MSCCAPKTGLARLAEDPGIILFAYLCALLPLAAIYALDFITERWKTIRKTRRDGKLHLAFSVPPLAVVVFYIHLQRLAEDYKEMATAITAALLCILHVLRTLWGLIQLHAFKDWNMHAFHVFTHVGFHVPIKAIRDEDKIDAGYEDSATESGSPLKKNSLTAPDSLHGNDSMAKRIAKYWSLLVGRLRNVPGLRRVSACTARSCPTFQCSSQSASRASKIETYVDKYMVVNSSLVDNEFSGAELPCRPNFSPLREAFRKPRLTVSDFLTCRKPEECAVRWAVSFLARFGSELLIETKDLVKFKVKFKTYPRETVDDYTLPKRIVAFIACGVTRQVEVKLENGKTSLQEVSALSPLHVICSDLLEPYSSTVKVSEENAFPYQMRGESKREEVEFAQYITSIRNSISAWHVDSLNELDEKEKNAVLNMNVHQVACFSKLIEEQNCQLGPIDMKKGYYDEWKTFLWQMGYRGDIDIMGEEVLNDFLCAVPVHKESLNVCVPYCKPGRFECIMLQASVHADNWLALEAGQFLSPYNVTDNELSEAEVQQWGQVFCTQKMIELRRLQLQVATESGRDVRTLGKIKFLGCVMEIVRSSLAFWLYGTPNASEPECFGEDPVETTPPPMRASEESEVDWNPPITRESFSLLFSDQLYEALQDAHSSMIFEDGSMRIKYDRKSLQMRLLWEAQLALIRTNNEGPGSLSLMILCMLGYPSLRFSTVNVCPPVYPSAAPDKSSSGNVILPIGGADESCVGPVHPDRLTSSVGECCDSTHSCLRIDVTEAPQPLHILFQLDSASKNASIQIGVDEGCSVMRFCWQSWKNGFMGRIAAQSEWRSTHIYHANEKMRKEAIISKINEGVPEEGIETYPPSESSMLEEKVTYWRGWPPFLSAIAFFEMKVSFQIFSYGARIDKNRISDGADLEAALDRVFGAQRGEPADDREAENEIDGSTTAIDCKCGCKDHMSFLKAKHLLDVGKEDDAVKLFQQCIVDSIHYPALECYVSLVINKLPEHAMSVFVLLYTMRDAIERLAEDKAENKCRKFKQYDLEKLIEVLDNVCEKTHSDMGFFYKAQALLLGSLKEDTMDNRCIEAFESTLMCENSVEYYYIMNHFCLALCYFRKYCSTGCRSDEEIGMQHMMSSCGLDYPLDFGKAFLLEKGSLSHREYQRVNIVPDELDEFAPRGIGLQKMMKYIFLLSSASQFRISRSAKAALNIYSNILSNDKAMASRAANRMAMMYHRGADGVVKNLPMAEELYTRAIDSVEMISEDYGPRGRVVLSTVMCNLGVLYGQRNDVLGDTDDSMKLFRKAIEEVEKMEELDRNSGEHDVCLYTHSSSMNNLAVMMELGNLGQKDIESAKRLYRRSVAIDENAIAMYNLAVLLKFEEPAPQNLEEAMKLFSALNDLGEDLLSMPVLHAELENAQSLCVTEISKVFSVDVDEIDDCLAYVKILNE